MAAKKKKRPTPPPTPVRTAPPRSKPVAGANPRQVEKAQAQAAVRRDAVRRRLVTAGVVTVALVAVGAYVVNDRRGESQLREALTAGSCTVDTRADPTSGAPGNHVPSPAYAVDPPAGGNHLGTGTASSGVYAGQRVPADGLLVHSLEHGYVVLWHQPSLPAPQLKQLVDLQEASGNDVIVVERASLTTPVAATAWGQRLLCGEVEPAALKRFVTERVGDGPEDVERT